MDFTLRNHPGWQRDCGTVPPQDPAVVALEGGNDKGLKGKLRRCCSAGSIGQRCTEISKIHRGPGQDIQLLLGYMMETEKRLILKTAADSAEEHYKAAGGDVKGTSPFKTQNGTQIGRSIRRASRPIRGGFQKEWRGPFPRP